MDEFIKPTSEQTAWVFRCLLENMDAEGTYRHLIYEIMGYSEKDYHKLTDALVLNNILSLYKDKYIEEY